MNRSIYIRKFFAIVLLAIFALSNTPTKFLHSLFANHKDFVSKTLTDSNNPQINAPGIDCHCQSNVVIAPYTMQSNIAVKSPVAVFFNYNITVSQNNTSFQPLSVGLRGPPFIS